MPTAGGILLFGDNRLQSFPDAWIQAGRFDGTNRATISDHAEFNGSLLAGIEQAIAFIEKHSMRGAQIGRLRRSERWSLPPVAADRALRRAAVQIKFFPPGAQQLAFADA